MSEHSRICLKALLILALVTVSLAGVYFSALAAAPASGTPAAPGPRAPNEVTYVVTTTADSGYGSLRWAITQANVNVGPDIINFDLPGSAPFTITLTSDRLPGITDTVTINAKTQAGYTGTPVIVLDGSIVSSFGLWLRADGNVVEGLSIVNFVGYAIYIDNSDNNTIQSNYLGVLPDGTKPSGYTQDTLFIDNSNHNQIGGTTAGEGNVLTGRDTCVYLAGTSTNNVFEGNYVGLGADGETSLGCGMGFWMDGNSTTNTIGGSDSGARNLISAAGFYGIRIKGGQDNIFQGNYIGTNASGTLDKGNGSSGIWIEDSSSNEIIDNLVSGNNQYGIAIVQYGAAADNNVIQGNWVGVNSSGTILRNEFSGIVVYGTTGTTIGGENPGEGNIISGNGKDSSHYGIYLDGSSVVVSATLVQGNLIGTNPAGDTVVGNMGAGIIANSTTNLDIISNTISGNGGYGMGVSTASGMEIRGNFIGTNPNGTEDMGNGDDGIYIAGSSNTIIHKNVVSGNAGYGIGMPFDADYAQITGNMVGVDASGTLSIPNHSHGIYLEQGDSAIIGAPGDGNIVAYNYGAGIKVGNWDGTTIEANTIHDNVDQGVIIYYISPGIGNKISSNSIFDNGALGIDLIDGTYTPGVTLNDPQDPDGYANRLQNFPEFTFVVTDGSIVGLLNSLASTEFSLQFFANPSCDPSGYGEGKTYLGYLDVTTDADGNAPFSLVLPIPAGQSLSATATNKTTGDTSEFSTCVLPSDPSITLQPETAHKYGDPGVTVVYTETLTNVTDKDDSFNVSLSGSTWPASLSIDNTGVITRFESLDFTILVTIPVGAVPATSDSVTVLVTSTTNSTYADSAVLTTTTLTGQNGYIVNEENRVEIVDTVMHVPAGTIDLSGYATWPDNGALSPDGNWLFVNSWDDNVIAISMTTKTPAYKLGVGSYPVGLAFTPDGSRVLVANEDSGNVSVVDVMAQTVAATVTLEADHYPINIATSPCLDKAYVTDYDTMSVIDLSTLATTTLSLMSTFDVVVSPFGDRAYAGNMDDSKIYVIDTSTDTVIDSWSNGEEYPEGLSLSSDGRYLYVAYDTGSITVIDVADGSVVDSYNNFDYPEYVEVFPSWAGNYAYVTNGLDDLYVINTISQMTSTVSLGGDLEGMALFPPSSTCGVYFNLSGQLTLDGIPAPDGTEIDVVISGTVVATTTTSTNGQYQVAVPGDNPATPDMDGGRDGDTISFGVAGYEIGQTSTWRLGESAVLALSNETFTYQFADLPVTTVVTLTARDGSPSLVMDPNGLPLGSTTITITANHNCIVGSQQSVERCFKITPEFTSGRNAIITYFFYSSQIPAGWTCSEINPYHWNGTTWDALTLDTSYGSGGRDCSAEPYSIRIKNVTTFSPFIFTKIVPTSIETTRLLARPGQQKALLPGLTCIVIGVILSGVILYRRRMRSYNRRNEMK